MFYSALATTSLLVGLAHGQTAGGRGSCCTELDIWEANAISNALTPHSCDQVSFDECSGDECGGTYSDSRYAGDCDPNGCDFNPYRVGVTDFYGEGMTVDTSKKMTIVTQFQGSSYGLQISRYYVQDSAVITQDWCNSEETAFAEPQYPFNDHGRMASVSEAIGAGMVLVMSLWDDHYANMLWLDNNYPLDENPSKPGVARGSCSEDSGVPSDVESSLADATVKFSGIKFGLIGSTFDMPAAQRLAKERREAKFKA